jgi:Dyp-type peroxidase family
MARDLAAEPLLPVDDIQGDVLIGLLKRVERLIFFHISDAGEFKQFVSNLRITSARDCLNQRALVDDRKAKGIDSLMPTPGLNIAFTRAGLHTLDVRGIDTAGDLQAFSSGMGSREAILGDPPQREWAILKSPRDLHGVFVLTGASAAELADTISRHLAPPTANGWRSLHEEFGVVRPDPVKGHEHFGFADGVSQPGVRGRLDDSAPLTPSNSPDENQGARGQDLLWPGEFVFGFPGQDPNAPEFAAKGPNKKPPIDFMQHGSFLVFRRLRQRVPEFHSAVKQASQGVGAGFERADPELLASQMVGRWKSGAPIIKAPTADDLSIADGTPGVNDFEFGDDRTGLLCPWAAHIRKAYPRNDVRGNVSPDDATVNAAEAFTQTHRMLRRGITFGPELTEEEALSGHSKTAHDRGLLFLCYVTSLENQFEFVQQKWVDSDDFSQPKAGTDPIIGSTRQPHPFMGAAPVTKDPDRKPQLRFPAFVEMQGGEYFFAPSITALRGLAKRDASPAA